MRSPCIQHIQRVLVEAAKLAPRECQLRGARDRKWMSGSAGTQGPSAERHTCATNNPDPNQCALSRGAIRPRVFSWQATYMEVACPDKRSLAHLL